MHGDVGVVDDACLKIQKKTSIRNKERGLAQTIFIGLT
jgi:hypothetical protein